MTVSEKGFLVVPKGYYNLPDEILSVDYQKLHMHWMQVIYP